MMTCLLVTSSTAKLSWLTMNTLLELGVHKVSGMSKRLLFTSLSQACVQYSHAHRDHPWLSVNNPSHLE